MSFPIPTLATILARVKGDLNSKMGNTNALIPRSLAWVTAHLIAGAVWGLYLYQEYIAKQVFPDTAEEEYLDRWARIWGLTRNAAEKADGSIPVSGVAGSTIPDGAEMTKSDGTAYIVTGGPYLCVAAPAKVTVDIEAVEVGVDGNADSGTVLTFTSPPSGVKASNTLTAALTGGAEKESNEDLLKRLLEHIQNPPQGGAAADYEAWAREGGAAAGVTVDQAWVETWKDDPNLDAGEVCTYFSLVPAAGDEEAGQLPGGGVCASVLAYIESKAPVTAIPVYAALLGQYVTFDIDVTLAAGYSAATAAEDIAAEFRRVFADEAKTNHDGYEIPNSKFQEALGRIEGIETFVITSVDGGAGSDNVAVWAGGGGFCFYPLVAVGDINLSEV